MDRYFLRREEYLGRTHSCHSAPSSSRRCNSGERAGPWSSTAPICETTPSGLSDGIRAAQEKLKVTVSEASDAKIKDLVSYVRKNAEYYLQRRIDIRSTKISLSLLDCWNDMEEDKRERLRFKIDTTITSSPTIICLLSQ